MSNRYVTVTISRQTKATSQAGFGTPLILSTDKNAAYKEYSGDAALAGISTDFGASSETYKLASTILGQTPRPEKIAIYGIQYTGSPAELVTALDELIKTQNEFFYLTSTEQGDAEITALSNWIGTQKKLYFASTDNIDLPAALNQVNAIVLVHNNPETYPAEALVGVGAPLEVGSFTWTFKTLNGIQPVTFDGPTIDEIEANNGLTYIREGGVDIVSKGQTTSGEYIDIIQGQYFVEARMVEAVFGLLARELKVPFTDAGIAMTVAEVENTLKAAAAQGVIATDSDGNALYEITYPTRAEISDNDKASRRLPNINWRATIAGAVEDVDINGTLQL